ncbi:hypothetical protein L345_07628, partial [Ophiophagus hannah]
MGPEEGRMEGRKEGGEERRGEERRGEGKKGEQFFEKKLIARGY